MVKLINKENIDSSNQYLPSRVIRFIGVTTQSLLKRNILKLFESYEQNSKDQKQQVVNNDEKAKIPENIPLDTLFISIPPNISQQLLISYQQSQLQLPQNQSKFCSNDSKATQQRRKRHIQTTTEHKIADTSKSFDQQGLNFSSFQSSFPNTRSSIFVNPIFILQMQLGGRCGYAPKGYYVVHGILTIPDDLNIAISGQQNEIDEFQGVLSSIFEFQDLNRNFQDIEIQQSEKSDENTLQFKPQVLWGMFFESYIHNGEVDNIFRWLDYNTEVDQIAVPPIESCIDQQFAQVPFHFLNDHETGRQKHSFQPIPSTLGKIFIVPDPSTSLFLDYSISSNNSLLKFELNDQESNIKEQFNKTQIIIPHQYSPFHLAKDIWQQLCPWSNPDTEFIHPMTKQEQDEKDSEYELEKSRMKDNDKQQNYQDQKEEISTFPETAD